MRHPSELIPSSHSQAPRIGELQHGAPLTSDGPDDPAWWSHDDHDHHFERLRDEHARRLDDEHRQWRRERFQRDFDDWRRQRGAPQDADNAAARPARALGPWGGGLSIAGGDLSPSAGGEADLASDNGQNLFERS
jgi:hypothetical protein